MVPAQSDPPAGGGPGSEDESVAYFIAHEGEIEERQRRWWLRVLPAIMAVVLIFATVVLYQSASDAQDADRQSHRAQTGGLRAVGVVTAVQNSTHTYTNPATRWRLPYTYAWYRAKLTIHLQPAVAGALTTTAYSPKRSSLVPGNSVTVLLDPDDLSYAEFNGMPLQRSGGWVILAVLLGLVLVADLAVVGAIARIWRSRRRHA